MLAPLRRPFRSDVVVVPLAWALEMLAWWGPDRTLLRGGGHAPGWLVPVCAAGVFATLVLRRRRPVSVLAVQVAWALAAAVLMMRYNAFAGVLVALHAVAARRSPNRSLVALVVCFIPFSVEVNNADRAPLARVIDAVVVLLMTASAWTIGYRRWLSDRRATEHETQKKVFAAEALRTERLRIARELHDIVAHAVSIMVLQAAGARAVLDTDADRARRALDTVQDVGGQAMSELRRLLGLLREAAGDPAEPEDQPSLDDLDRLLERSEAAGLVVTKEVIGTPRRLDPSVALAGYRLVQEALTNTMKHAGPRAEARVSLDWTGQHLAIAVEDRAPGGRPRRRRADHLSTGHGLLGLRERIRTVGGTLQAGEAPDGFAVHAVLPAAGARIGDA